MPWFKSDNYIPPINKELWLFFKDGHREKRKLEDVEVYNGLGGIQKDAPTHWANPDFDGLADPVDEPSPFESHKPITEHHEKLTPIFSDEKA